MTSAENGGCRKETAWLRTIANQAPCPMIHNANQANVANLDSCVREESIKAIEAVGKIRINVAARIRKGISQVIPMIDHSVDSMTPNT